MRRRVLGKLPEADTSGQTMEEIARSMMIDRFGPRTASWLIMKHRRLLHRRGQFDAVIRRGEQAPPWFDYAMGLLRKRGGWAVDLIEHQGERRYRIKWLGWMSRSRAARVTVSRETVDV